MGEPSNRPLVLAEDLLTALHKSPLPFALVDVAARVVLDANTPARRMLGSLCPVGEETPLRDVVLAENLPAALEILDLLDRGALDSYQAQRTFRTREGDLIAGEVWVQSIRELLPHAALVVFTPAAETPAPMADLEADGNAASGNAPVVVGLLDLELRIVRVSADTHELFGRRAESLYGLAFVDVVHPDDVASFLMAAGRALSQHSGTGQRLRVGSADAGGWVSVRLHLAPLPGGTSAQLGFVLAAAPPDVDLADHAADLEQRLWRIAREVQAAGVVTALPDVPANPPVHDLSSRQWEILARLLRGERVPGIARDMYLSQSTVRNHLAAIFRKTGVNSQADLLALLRENRQSV